MLTLGGVDSGSVVYDLGCGQGDIVLAAAKRYGAKKAVGIEKSQRLCNISLKKTAGLSNAFILCADYDKVDISEANKVTLYQSASENARLKQKFLQELSPGTTIISHDFGIPGWHPQQFETFREGRHGFRVLVYAMGIDTP
jgi:ubiquinone/menaquinone biosynthesis C-methylase UbiE